MQAHAQAALPAQGRKGTLPALSYIYNYGIYVVFAMLVVFFSLSNPRFLSPENLLNILQQSAPLAIAAVGITFVLVVAGIDISIGQNMFLSAIIVGVVVQDVGAAFFEASAFNTALLYLLAVAVGSAVGVVNGFIIARFKIVPFIVTLATYGIARGLGLILGNTSALYVDPLRPVSNERLLGVPVVVLIALVLVLFFQYVLGHTPFGRQLMAIGNDAAAAQKIGIPVTRNIFLAYVLCGALAGLAAALQAGQIASIALNFASGHEFLVISAAVLGGTSLFGGKGSVFPGAIIGILLVMTILNGMAMISASPYVYTVVRGAIVFVAVMMDSVNYKGELR